MRKSIIIVVSLILLFCVAYLASNSFEYYNESVDLGWSNEARVNDFFAAEKFIENRGIEVGSVVRLPAQKMLFASDILLVPNANLIQLESQKQMLLEWVQSGGSLIIGAGYGDSPAIIGELQFSRSARVYKDYSGEDDELESLPEEEEKSVADLLREENERIRNKSQEPDSEKEDVSDHISCESMAPYCGVPPQPEVKDENLSKLSFEIAHPAKINMPWSEYLQHDAFEEGYGNKYIELDNDTAKVSQWSGDANGITYAKVDFGSGVIHVFSDLEFLSNSSLPHFDHAYVLAKLSEKAESMLILYGKDMPSLALLLYRHFFEALICLCLLIFFGILYFGRRIGLVEDLPVVARRSRAERYSAVARFRWQNQGKENIIASARDVVFKKTSRRWPAFNQWQESKQVETLASFSSFSESAVYAALYGNDELSEHSFTNIIKVLQALRNNL